MIRILGSGWFGSSDLDDPDPQIWMIRILRSGLSGSSDLDYPDPQIWMIWIFRFGKIWIFRFGKIRIFRFRKIWILTFLMIQILRLLMIRIPNVLVDQILCLRFLMIQILKFEWSRSLDNDDPGLWCWMIWITLVCVFLLFPKSPSLKTCCVCLCYSKYAVLLQKSSFCIILMLNF